MGKPETSDQPATIAQRLELQPGSPFQADHHAPSITVQNCTEALISVLADIILATCVSNEQNETRLDQPSDNQ